MSFIARGICSSSVHRFCKLYFNNFTLKMSRNMSLSPSKDFQQEKEKYLQMPLEEKRRIYQSENYVTLDEVPTWEAYFKERDLQKSPSTAAPSELDIKLSRLVSMWKGDITKLEIDAVVNAANKYLQRGGGVDGAIHEAAGPDLKEECRALDGCETGKAKLAGGYKLPAKYIIQTVGPMKKDPQLLTSCYLQSLELATSNQLRTIAFPCISTGVYGYPPRAAAEVATTTVRKFLEENSDKIDRVIFCLFMDTDVDIYEDLLQKLFPVS